MSIPDQIYLLSNSCEEIFNDNSLTKFYNTLPNIISLENENIQVSLEAIGFSCKFRNVVVPNKVGIPSIVVTDIGLYNSNCMLALNSADEFRAKVCMDGYNFDFSKTESELVIFKEYFLEDRWYTDKNVIEMCKMQNEDNLLKWEFKDKTLTISNNPKQDFWVLIHPTFMETFKITNNSLITTAAWEKRIQGEPLTQLQQLIFGMKTRTGYLSSYDIYKDIFKKIVTYKNEIYFGFYLNVNSYKIIGGKCVNFQDERIPEIIRVQSSIISSQIFNNTHSKDLLCFCPDFKNVQSNYFYKEFDQPQKIKLANTTLRTIDIALTDENTNQLQLLPGVPTLLKLKFDRIKMNNKSFNVRITSKKSEFFPDNNNTVFKIQLPNTLSFNQDRNWKVALTSISHPNLFNTFVGDRFDRIIIWQMDPKQPSVKLEFRDDKVYTKDEIVNDINSSLSVGMHAKFVNGNQFQIEIKNGTAAISNYLLGILGYKGLINFKKKFTSFKKGLHIFDGGFDLNFLAPDYIVAYANIVQPTIVGSEYRDILRIIPIPRERSNYVIQEFKNKNYLPLLNTEISVIEINFRNHDGTLSNFIGSQHIIMNLEFSNLA